MGDEDPKTGERLVSIRDLKRHRPSSPDAITLAECPLCDGEGMVTYEKKAEWIIKYPDLDPKPPPSEPDAA